MPSLKKMRAIREQQRVGKVSPLDPGRQIKKKAAAKKPPAKKAAAKTKPKAKTPKVKATDAVKKVVTSGVGRTVLGMAARAIPIITAPIAAFATLAKMTDMAFKRKPGEKGRSIKTKNFSIKAVDTSPFGISLGKQVTPYKRPERTVDTSPKPNPENVYEKPKGPLGKQKDAGKSLRILAEEKAPKTRGVTKPKSKPTSVPTSVPAPAPAPTLVKKVVSEPTQHRITNPKATEVKVVAAEKPVAPGR